MNGDNSKPKPLDVLHSQTEQGALERNGNNASISQSTTNTKAEAVTVKPSTIPIPNIVNKNIQNPISDIINKLPKDFLQKSIRTYESDMAEILAKKNTSVVKMVVAENKKTEGVEVIKNKNTSKVGKNILKSIISLIFLGAGITGGYYLYLKSPLAIKPIIKSVNKIPSIITPNIQKIVPIKSLNKQEFLESLIEGISENTIDSGKIIELVPVQGNITTVSSTTEIENGVKITASKFVNSLDFDMTDTLKRSLTDKWMFGIYGADGEKVPFIILTNNFFQNAYAGMLKWEESMPDELAILFDYKNRAYNTESFVTASTTSYFNIQGRFQDKIIRNRDIREFTNNAGEMLVLYSFLDKDTIVISTSESIISAIIERIEKQNYVR